MGMPINQVIRADEVTVIIPAYNAAAFVVDAIESVLRQSAPPAEVIVVDDGSTDGTAAAARGADASVRILSQHYTGLPAAARNTGARTARTGWLAFLDADDTWLPRKLEKQLRVASSSNVGMVHTDRFNVGARGDLPEIQSRIQPLFEGDVFEPLLLMGNCITLSSVLIRTDVFRNLYGFSEDPELKAAEDWDLWVRVAESYSVAAVDEPLVCYRFHDTNTSSNPRRMQRARWRVVRRALLRPRGRLLPPGTRRRIVAATARANAWDAARRGVWTIALSEYARAVSARPFDLAIYRDLARAALARP